MASRAHNHFLNFVSLTKKVPIGLSQYFDQGMSHNWKGQLSITKHLQNGLSQTNGAFGLSQCATCVVSHKHITAHKTGPSASHKGNDQLVSHKQQLDWSLTSAYHWCLSQLG